MDIIFTHHVCVRVCVCVLCACVCTLLRACVCGRVCVCVVYGRGCMYNCVWGELSVRVHARGWWVVGMGGDS